MWAFSQPVIKLTPDNYFHFCGCFSSFVFCDATIWSGILQTIKKKKKTSLNTKLPSNITDFHHIQMYNTLFSSFIWVHTLVSYNILILHSHRPVDTSTWLRLVTEANNLSSAVTLEWEKCQIYLYMYLTFGVRVNYTQSRSGLKEPKSHKISKFSRTTPLNSEIRQT